ncbi:MAG: Fic family protein [Rickettsiales bacterium]|nr:Fic family protein [Rickettsiales bacterium]
MTKKPPFQIDTEILKRIKEISHELGVLSGAKLTPVPVKLRRSNKIKTIQSSLGIEGNNLSVEQVTDIIAGKRVIASQKDVQEANNAIEVYKDLHKWNPLSMSSLKEAHKILMNNLVSDNGKFRSSDVGIFKSEKVVHVAPSAKRVTGLMTDLFNFLKLDESVPWIIKACVFYYELEFIHPFQDGNGRIGRLWQQLLLMKEDPIFEFISVESITKSYQDKYYDVLAKCDSAGESTAFIEFSLDTILIALKSYIDSMSSQVIDSRSRLEHARKFIGDQWFFRKDYVQSLKNISTATASRDLQKGLEEGYLVKNGNINQSRYKFKK